MRRNAVQKVKQMAATGTLLAFAVILAFAVVLVVQVQPCYAQEAGYATINGTVTDPSNAVVGGANIAITNLDTGVKRNTVTGSSGDYSAPYLPLGHYSVTASHSGFKTTTQSNITLSANQIAAVNLVLSVGQAEETVQVTTSQEMIETTSPSLDAVVNSASVVELPLNGRDPGDLTYIVPGAINAAQRTTQFLTAGSNGMPNEIGASIDASRNGGVYFTLDGIYNMDSYLGVSNPFPNSDATQEFRVMTNNFSPQYGGGSTAVVSVVTKSGTNQWHGNSFLFSRNQYFNAKDWATAAKDGYTRTQYGMGIGGPIKKDKHFIFGNVQITKASLAQNGGQGYSPTGDMVNNGDFSALLPTQLYYPASFPQYPSLGCSASNPNPGHTSYGPCSMGGAMGNNPVGKPITGNNVTTDPQLVALGGKWSNILDPVSKNLETHLPSTTGIGLINIAGSPQQQNTKEFTAKYDWHPGSKNSIMGRAFIEDYKQPATSNTTNWLATGEGSLARNQNYGGTWTYTPTATLANIFKFGFDETNSSAVPGVDKGWKDLGSSLVTPDDTVTVLEEWGSTGPYWVEQYVKVQRHNFDLGDDVSLSKGKNVIVAGVSLLTQYYSEYASWGADPPIGFSGSVTGSGFSDILFGDLASFQQLAAQSYNFTSQNWNAYGQDAIRLKPNLTVTVGVRWEPATSPTSNPAGAASEFWPGHQSTTYPNAPTGLVFVGDAGVPAGGVPNDYGRVSPRIGIAWQPTFLPNTSIRLSAGRFGQPFYWFGYGKTAPFLPSYSWNNTTSPGCTGVSVRISIDNPWGSNCSTAGASLFPTTSSFTGIKPDKNVTFGSGLSVSSIFTNKYKNGWSQNWNLSIEHQFGGNLLVNAAYVGNEGYHITTTIDENPGIYSAGGARTRYPQFSSIQVYEPIGTYSYNGLHLSVEKRMSHGLQLSSNYSWSKAFDLVDESDSNIGSVRNPFNPKSSRGISGFNVPYIWNTFATWQLPAFKGHGNLAGGALGNWEISGIFTASAGLPFTISPGGGNNNSGSQGGNDWADRVPGVPLNVHKGSKSQWLNQYFNPAAFTANAAGTFGNSGKNIMRGPGQRDLDVAIVKNFPFNKEQYRFQFRAEAFNATNTPFFNIPDTTIGDSNFGKITNVNGSSAGGTSGNSSGQGAGDGGRIMQFALKFYW